MIVTMGSAGGCMCLGGRPCRHWPLADTAVEDLDALRAIRLDIADRVLDLLKELLP